MMRGLICFALTAGLLLSACQEKKQAEKMQETSPKGEATMAIMVTSSAFDEGKMIPGIYTCDGKDISPPLKIEGIPDETKSIALISDDPDAPMGTWVHWVLYNLPPDTRDLQGSIPPDETLANGARHGISDFGRFGYGGPCPPSGVHRYFFKVYALDAMLELSGQVTKSDLLTAMEGHILAEGQLIGRYKRQ
jgi:Raf kinase inhibitor-like YbhB/YbcL family protein